jgi:hypothetical protein
LVLLEPKNHLRSHFHSWRWHLLRTWNFLTEKPLMKTGSLGPKKSSKKPSSTANAEIFMAHRLLPTQK